MLVQFGWLLAMPPPWMPFLWFMGGGSYTKTEVLLARIAEDIRSIAGTMIAFIGIVLTAKMDLEVKDGE